VSTSLLIAWGRPCARRRHPRALGHSQQSKLSGCRGSPPRSHGGEGGIVEAAAQVCVAVLCVGAFGGGALRGGGEKIQGCSHQDQTRTEQIRSDQTRPEAEGRSNPASLTSFKRPPPPHLVEPGLAIPPAARKHLDIRAHGWAGGGGWERGQQEHCRQPDGLAHVHLQPASKPAGG